MSANERITRLVKLIGGDPGKIKRDYAGTYSYHEAHGSLDIRISNTEAFECPWVDIYHFGVGSIGLFRVQDDNKSAELIEDYKELFGEAAGDD